MEKLISMTDFVLEQKRIWSGNENEFYEVGKSSIAYASFLKQPLTLGMFVACHDGKIIPHPDNNLESGNEDSFFWNLHKTQYQEAKEKVLFKDCSVKKITDKYTTYFVVYFKSQQIWVSWTNRNIEDMIKNNLELTESAIKQIYG